MEGKKLEISGKEAAAGDPPNATYKPIPESDIDGKCVKLYVASCVHICPFLFVLLRETCSRCAVNTTEELAYT